MKINPSTSLPFVRHQRNTIVSRNADDHLVTTQAANADGTLHMTREMLHLAG